MSPLCSSSVLFSLALFACSATSLDTDLADFGADFEEDAETMDYMDPAKHVPLKTLLSSHSDVICGGEELWQMMSQGSTVRSITNIKWATILGKADDYIKTQTFEGQKLAKDLKNLQARIDEKRKQEKLRPTTKEDVDKMIADGLEVFKGDDDSMDAVDEAKRTGCGHPSHRPRAPRRAYRKSLTGFKGIATSTFDGTVILHSSVFREECDKLLPCISEQCYCEQLCQDFQDTAQDLSDATAGALVGKSVAELLQEYNMKVNLLKHSKLEATQCTADRALIENYSEEIEKMKVEYKDKFAILMAAMDKLEDLLEQLGDVEDSLKEQQGNLDAAMAELKKAGIEHAAAEKALNDLKAKEAAALAAVSAGQAALAKAQELLADGQSANRAVSMLKSAVSTTALQMALYFKTEVQTPIEDMGWTEDMNLNDYFHADPTATKAGVDLKKAMVAMETHCKTVAIKAFKAPAVVRSVDLSPLCNFGATDDLFSQINTEVLSRMKETRDHIEIVKSWLNPYRGLNLTDAQVKEIVAKGEPEGLRSVISVYGSTKFFGYLKRWMLGGELLGLIGKLGNVVEDMDAAVDKANAELAKLRDHLEKVKAAREEASKKLQDAMKELEAKKGKSKSATDIVDKLKEQDNSMKNKVEELQAAVDKAVAEWKKAKAELEEMHKQALSLLQSLDQGSQESLEERAAAVAADISRARQALDNAKDQKREADLAMMRITMM